MTHFRPVYEITVRGHATITFQLLSYFVIQYFAGTCVTFKLWQMNVHTSVNVISQD